MGKEDAKCGAIVRFGDEAGEFFMVFRCGLEKDHEGRHVEESEQEDGSPYRMEWEGDAREQCEKCKKMAEAVIWCAECNDHLCSDCWGEDWTACKRCVRLAEAEEEIEEEVKDGEDGE
jgi:hypothetical protein